jgi:hypothetical protein
VFDNTAKTVVVASQGVATTNSQWYQVQKSGTVPAGGDLFVRVGSSGTVEAYIDDLALAIP